MVKVGAMVLKTMVPGIPKSVMNWVLRIDGEALGATNGGDGVGAAER